MLEVINKDMIDAMKSKDTLKLSTLRMLKGAIDLERINKRLDKVSDDDIVTIITKQIKTRKESIAEFENIYLEEGIKTVTFAAFEGELNEEGNSKSKIKTY